MPVKFLCDENISSSLAKSLRKKGYDVKDIKEEKLFGTPDSEIIKIAFKENRIILSHDKDFANLVSYKKSKHKGVILIRFRNQSPDFVVARFGDFLVTLIRRD